MQAGGTLADYAAEAVSMKNRLSDPSTAHIVVVDVLDRNGTLVDRFVGLHAGTAIFDFSKGKNVTRAEVEEGGRLMAVWYFKDGHKELEGLDGNLLNTPLMNLGYEVLGAYAKRNPPLSGLIPTRVATDVAVPAATLEVGMRSEDAGSLQRMLNDLGITDYDGKALVVDGDFGRRTESAVKKLQEILNEAGITASNGSPLAANGAFDYEMQQAVRKYLILVQQAPGETEAIHTDVTRRLWEPVSRGGYLRSSLDIADKIHGEIRDMIDSGKTAGLGKDSYGGLESGCAVYVSRFLQKRYPDLGIPQVDAVRALLDDKILRNNPSQRNEQLSEGYGRPVYGEPTDGGMMFSYGIAGASSRHSNHVMVTIWDKREDKWYVYEDYIGLMRTPLEDVLARPMFGNGIYFARYPGT